MIKKFKAKGNGQQLPEVNLICDLTTFRRYCQYIVLSLCIGLNIYAAEPASESKNSNNTVAPTLLARCGLPFQDNAVLQQKLPLPVWGKSLPAAKVTVTFDNQSQSTVANKNGAWRVVLDPMIAIKLASVNQIPQGKTMVIVCELNDKSAVKEIKNIVIGEVWICAGQSNMAGSIKTNRTRHFPKDTLEKADYPALRQMQATQQQPWLVCSSETAPRFKKVAFFFGRRLQRDALVPVGLISAAVGGSNIESWLHQPPFSRGKNYERIIAPIVGYGIRGTIWYQGESNERDGRQYLPKLSTLISGWRAAWNQPSSQSADGPHRDFSFYFVQLPGIGTSSGDNPAGGDGRAEIRNAQLEALAIRNTGMAVAIDVGDVREHPPNKYDTGVRLARLALHKDYGFKDLVPAGPLYKEHKIEGHSIRICFNYAQNGLMLAQKEGFLPPKPTPDAKMSWLSVKAQDGTWHWAEGKIDGADLVVSCKGVNKPVAVRYGYTNHPVGSLLYNKDGLPASPFTTNGYDAIAK